MRNNDESWRFLLSEYCNHQRCHRAKNAYHPHLYLLTGFLVAQTDLHGWEKCKSKASGCDVGRQKRQYAQINNVQNGIQHLISSVMHWNQMNKLKISCHKQSISITSFFTAWINLNLQNWMGCGDDLGSKRHSCFIEYRNDSCEKYLNANAGAGFNWVKNVNFENFARNRGM